MRLIRACAVLLLLAAPLSIAPTALAQGTQADRIQETVATAKFKKAPPYRIGVAAAPISRAGPPSPATAAIGGPSSTGRARPRRPADLPCYIV